MIIQVSSEEFARQLTNLFNHDCILSTNVENKVFYYAAVSGDALALVKDNKEFYLKVK